MKGAKGKAPTFENYHDFLMFCQENRRAGMRILEETKRYTPFVFGSKDSGTFTLCAGYRVIKDLSKILKPRSTTEYKAWRKSVFNRDNYRCRECGSSKNLHAHHIVRVSDSLKDATSVDNGLTLCVKCHRKVHSNE